MVERRVSIKVTADSGQATKELSRTVKSVQELDMASQTLGATLALTGGAISVALGFAVKSAGTLEAAMQNVNSIARLGDSELGKLTTQVRALAVEMGKSPSDLADGLYSIQGSGFAAADALEVLEAATYAAGAGLTSTGVAAEGITAVLNSYQLSADEAGNVSDILFKIVDSGVITFEELAGSIGRVLPVASALNVPIEELAAAYAELTRVGINASEAETQIAAVLQAALSPTEALADAVEQYGYASAEALVSTQGFAGFLEFLASASGGSATQLSALLGNVRAVNGAMALLNNDMTGYTSALQSMNSAAQDGAFTQSVFAEQTDTTLFSVQQLSSSINDLKIIMGNALSPVVRVTADVMKLFVDGLRDMPGPLQTAVTLFGSAAAGMGLLTGAAVLAIPRLLEFRNAMATIGGIRGVAGLLAGALNPATLAVGGLTLAAGLGIVAWQKYKGGTDDTTVALLDLATAADLTEGKIRQLILTGSTDLAAKMEDLNSATQDAIDSQNELAASLVASQHGFDTWFAGLDPSNATTFILDYLRNAGSEGFRQWAIETQALGENTQHILDQIISGSGEAIRNYSVYVRDAVAEYVSSFGIDESEQARIQTELNEVFDLFSNPNIDPVALNNVLQDAISAFKETGDLDAFTARLDAIERSVSSTADPFGILKENVRDTAKEFEVASSAVEAFLADIGDPQLLQWNLELMGWDQAAEDVGTFTEMWTSTIAEIAKKTVPIFDESTGAVLRFVEVMSISEEESWKLTEAYNAFLDALASGNYDNAKLLADLSMADTANDIYLILQNLDDYEKTIHGVSIGQALLNFQLKETRRLARASAEEIANAHGILQDSFGPGMAYVMRQEGLRSGSVFGGALLEEMRKVQAEWAERGLSFMGADTIVETLNLTSLGTEFTKLASDIQGANMTMATSFRVLVENTNALGNTSQSIEDWADKLIAARGTVGEIDRLVKNGLITGTSGVFDDDSQYARAQQAYDDIVDANGRIQDSILAVQAIQAPFMAQWVESQATLLYGLRQMPEEQQRVVLGWMDANSAAQANEAIAIAAAAANGELGESGTEAATKFIEGAIAANPYLEAMLTDIGLVARDHEGNLVINFEDAATGKSEIEMLTESIDALIVAIGGVPPIHITLQDDASRGIDSVANSLDRLDGRVANTYIRTHYESRGLGPTQYALGGVARFAGGGVADYVPVWAAENGPEVAHFATGGSALLPYEGLYGVPPMTYISPAHANSDVMRGGTQIGPFNITGNSIEEIVREVSDSLREALAQEAAGVL